MKDKKENKILKYFELPIQEAKKWTAMDYFVFVIESTYSTIFPFFAGILLVKERNLIWIFMLILPIYFKLHIQKNIDSKKKKRIYIE